jgi:hypothetical protein
MDRWYFSLAYGICAPVEISVRLLIDDFVLTAAARRAGTLLPGAAPI